MPGHKILGPFTVGDGARVGSNAVVLEGVPSGANRGRRAGPCRALPRRRPEVASSSCATRARARLARPAFDAYGVPGEETEDPTVAAIEGLRAEIRELHHELDALRRGEADRETRGARAAGGGG